MENIKLSIIVPIYNAAEYLEKSLLFLSKQTLSQIEIILINDASTDNSPDIMTAFKIAFPEKFVVINSEKNRGPGGARNIGLSCARGEYIGFVDSDDFANPEMFELMYNKAKEKDSDMVMCAYRHKGINVDNFIDLQTFKDGLTINARKELIAYTGFIWHSIFKRKLLRDMDILFREKYTFQDIDFLLDVYCRIESIDFVAKSLYLYTDNKASVSHQQKYIDKYNVIIEECLKAIFLRCEKSKYYSDVKEAVEYTAVKISSNLLSAIIADREITPEKINWFNCLVKKYVPHYMENKYIKNNSHNSQILSLYNENSEIFYKNVLNFFNSLAKQQISAK